MIHAEPVAHNIGWRHLQKAYKELFCYPDTQTPRANDFSDKREYLVAKTISKAVAHIRNPDGTCTKDARHFLLDQLRFNDNSDNEWSDVFQIANLLSALTDCLLPSKKKDVPEEMVFGAADEDEFEEDTEPQQFRRDVIEELDRYRRSDEWIHSYHNIYTTTVLECKCKLMKAGVIPQDPMEFAQYLHDGTADEVRIQAWNALIDLGFLTEDTVAALLLKVMSTDSSPYVRRQLYERFCLGLASIALGERKVIEPPAAPGVDGDGGMLIIEEEASNNARKDHIARTTTIDGALAALKTDLKDNASLKEVIWEAVTSSVPNFGEVRDLLDICSCIYDARDSLLLKLSLPRYWKIEREGPVCCINVRFHMLMLTVYSETDTAHI